MTIKKLKGFTLVELIVVITILAVLATVAFISFQGYSLSSRDSVRLSDIKNISKSFELNRTKGIDFPLPNKKVDITASGTIFQYQGELSKNILNSDLGIFDGGVDPLTGENYGYAVNTSRNKFQIIGFLEAYDSISRLHTTQGFADNTGKYIKSTGDDLAILLDETTLEVIVDENNANQIDIVNTSNEYQVVIGNKGNGKLQSSDFYISQFLPLSSCKKLYEYGEKASGVYEISLDGINSNKVYCDMKTNNGGWSLAGVFDSNGSGNWSINSTTDLVNWTNDTVFGTGYITNPYVNVEQKYETYSKLGFSDMMFVRQDTNEVVLSSHNCNVNKTLKELFANTAWQTAAGGSEINSICGKEAVTIDKSKNNPFYGTAYGYRNNSLYGGLNINISDNPGIITDDFAMITTAIYETGYIGGIQTRGDTTTIHGVSDGSGDWNDPVGADYGILLFVK